MRKRVIQHPSETLRGFWWGVGLVLKTLPQVSLFCGPSLLCLSQGYPGVVVWSDVTITFAGCWFWGEIHLCEGS